MALEDFELEPVDPLVQSGFADVGLRAQQRGDVRHIQKGMLQLVAQMIFQGAAEHVLVERRMKGQDRAVTDVLHEFDQCQRRVTAGGNRAGADAVDQYAGTEFDFGALQGAFELLAEIDRAVLDHHCADGQHAVLVQVQPGGFQVQYDPALFAQAAFTQPSRCWQALQAKLQLPGQDRAGRAQP